MTDTGGLRCGPPVRVSDGIDHLLRFTQAQRGHPMTMIIVGIILLLLGFVLSVPILWTLGLIVLVIGLILMVLGSTGRTIGGRSHYW